MTDVITTTGFRSVVSRNPATGETLAQFECATPDQVYAAVGDARTAQKKWAALPVDERLSVLKRFQRELHEHKDEVAELISRETGKPSVEALVAEVIVTLDAAAFLLRHTRKFLRPEHVGHSNPIMKSKRSYLLREPYGVIGIISPWNYPFSIPVSDVMAALVCGNAVILKP